MAAGEVDIVIGTQLVAKGHNFPHLTLVGVVDADLGLASATRARPSAPSSCSSRSRAAPGAATSRAAALLQTCQPDHPVMQALVSGDAERFYARGDRRARERAGLPPFGRLAALIVSAADRGAGRGPRPRAWRRAAPPPPGVEVLGPAEAPLALMRGRHRFRLLVKTERAVDLQAYLRAWLARGPKPRGNRQGHDRRRPAELPVAYVRGERGRRRRARATGPGPDHSQAAPGSTSSGTFR